MIPETRKQLAALLADEDPDVRRRAAEDLSRCTGLAAVAALAAALEDESKGVRDAAARSLQTIGGMNVARAIVEYLDAKNIVTRNLASELLMKLGSTSIPAILPYLEHPSQDTRKFAVDILGLIGNEEPTQHLLPLLVDTDENVVVSTVEALGNMKSARSLPFLFEAYDRDDYTRPAVAEALGKIGDPSASGFLMDRLRQSLLTVAADPVTPFAIIEALGALGGDGVLAVLESVVTQVKGRVRSTVLLAISRISDRHQRPLPSLPGLRSDFLAALNEDDLSVQISAVKWLAGFKEEDVTTALVRRLGIAPELDAVLGGELARRDDTFRLCVNELPGLPMSQHKSVVAIIGRLTMDVIRRVMSGGLGKYDENFFTRAFDVVTAEWEGGDEETRAAIVDVLFHLDGDRAVMFLDAIMNDPDPWLRIHVIEVIAAIADRRAPDFIARFLEDDDEMVREVAVSTLQSRGYDPATVTPGA
ncbi:MAG: HEAT repeat domain-containing protein [Ignavibacteriae bacterium]|nr:HEAT repeat domain-containing protein [Ignavibacteriota bacterium]